MKGVLPRRDQELFRDAIREILGLHFDDAKLEDVGATLRDRMSATRRDAASYLRLLRGPEGRAEARVLAELLTVSETYFFRNREQFRALVEVAIPERLASGPPAAPLRLLSAGCSSGEEAYTLAIAIRESFPELFESGRVRIAAVDANPVRLARAIAGRYAPWSLRETPDAVRGRWFRPSGNDFVLDERIRRAVSFEERNLVDDDPAFWAEGAYDVVFFRNVGMYFSPGAMHAVTARIARALAQGGFLFLGHAETLRGVSQEFHLRHSHECFYYQARAGHDGEVRAPALASSPAPSAVRDVIPRIVESASSWVDAIQRASERIAALEAPPRSLATSPAHPARPARQTPRPLRQDLAAAVELVRDERLAEAMEVVSALPAEAGADPDAQLLRAALLTSCGRLDEAEQLCQRLLRLDELDAGAHYLAALCREHAGDREGAAEHDRAAAYVDPGFAMPRLHLGLLARRAGDLETARHELGQAAVLLQREDASRILLFGGGFRREGLVQLCLAELRACGGDA